MPNTVSVSPTVDGRSLRRTIIGAVLTGATILSTVILASGKTASRAPGVTVTTVFTTPLQNVPGQRITVQKVSYGPGTSSPSHQHAGSVFAYVLTGAVRSENSATGAVRVYKAGECFFEPPLSKHLVSANASATETAGLLAVFVAEEGADLTTPIRP